MNQDEGTSLQAILRRPRVEIDVEHYYAGVEIAYDGGVNLAFTGDAPSVPPRMVQHSLRMAQRIYRVAERVYCAVGYALGNVVFIVGDEGIVVLDTTEKKEGAEAAREAFYRACPAARPLPFVAVIYSHNHTDLERLVTQALNSPHGAALDPGVAEALTRQASERARAQEDLGVPACLLVPDLIRAPIARLLKRAAPRLKVLSHSEIPDTHSIRIGSVIGASP